MNNPKKVFLYYLSNVKKILEENDNVDSHLKHQLTDTMFPAHQHISTAVSFTLRCCCQLASREILTFYRGTDRAALIDELKSTMSYLDSIPDKELESQTSMQFGITAGFAERSFERDTFINIYAIPNFLFHISMAYASLKVSGLSLGKADFDQIHQYPDGFCFE
ncbi:DUF1993 family protein [Alteromonas sp. K632G]|jgi:hypothetical protein|uniref:DUF1993 family protein n=1 Tax=Alteromonas sp. K632G TaxID=2820757 RepID=UPI000C0C8174|nr:DUF1993 family protein [Alteromonas sp. K632G]MBO7924199.1 DUF1993 family protein [Alteromonas sp. K632G]PHS44709.1 MAG: hypothetical protein COB03_18320 [Alteromonas sp.]|tara:strand:+ start:5473 stop:5964 length:492 start_codon:yes stop_codon:yes gene_type:complete